MTLSCALRRAAAITAVAMLVATSAQASPSGILLQTAPSDDETTFNGVSIVGPSAEELARARDAIGSITNELERAEAELDLIEDELALVEQQLAIASDELAQAEEVSWQATDAANAARDELARVQGELDAARQAEADNHAQLTGFARDAYMFGPSATDPTLMLLDGMGRNGGSDLAKAQQALDVVARDRTQLLEVSEVLVATTASLEQEADLMEQARAEREAEADAAREDAARKHATVMDLLNETEATLERQDELIDELGLERQGAISTLDDLEEEAARAKEAAAAKRKAEEEARKRAEEAAQRAAEAQEQAEKEARDAAAQRAADEAARAAAAAEEAEAEAEQAESARAEREAVGSVSVSTSSGGLATVGGITVSASIAGQLQSLLNAARADGIVLSGGGYRSPDVTAALRIANGCPDVYTSPASSCRIPTAIPGSSMHEKGLAIDFTWNGSTICYPNRASNCHGNAAFDWLNANAASYGLYGMGAEAWHWSTNGN